MTYHSSDHHEFRAELLRDAEKGQGANEPNLEIVGEDDLRRGEFLVGRGVDETKEKTDVEENVRRQSNGAEEQIVDEVVPQLADERTVLLAEKLKDNDGDLRQVERTLRKSSMNIVLTMMMITISVQ